MMNAEREPFQKGLFSEDGDGALLASQCPTCGQTFFPRRENCLECAAENMNQIELKGAVKLYSYTKVMMPVHKYKPPFTLAWVEFPEKVRVMGQVTDPDIPLVVGMELKLIIDTLWTEENKQIIGYKFQPIVK